MNDELEELRRKKLQQMQEELAKQKEAEEQARLLELQKELLLKKILTPEAKSRLANIKLANPEFAAQVEVLLIRLYQMGKVTKLTDEEFKQLLLKIRGKKKETKIIRK